MNVGLSQYLMESLRSINIAAAQEEKLFVNKWFTD